MLVAARAADGRTRHVRRRHRDGPRAIGISTTHRHRSRRPARQPGAARADGWRAARRLGLSRALSLDRIEGRAHSRLGRRHRAARTAATGRPLDRRLGASDVRHRAALRAVARDLPVPADPGTALDGGAWLHRRGDRLSRARHAGSASLSRRRERGPRRARHRARRARSAGAGGAKDFALWGHSQGGQAVLFAGSWRRPMRPISICSALPLRRPRPISPR